MDEIILSPDQEEGCQNLMAALRAGERILVLSGPAGTGKTTLVVEITRRVAADGWRVQYAAPTGKAAERLAKVTGLPATTIHSVLFGTVRETEEGVPVFLDSRAPCLGRTLFIVDEASMVDDNLGRIIESELPDNAALLYVGDQKQLPPVMGSWAADFDNPTAELTQIHRQALESPILRISVSMREGGRLPEDDIGEAYKRRSGTLRQVADMAVRMQEENQDSVVLCWTNKTRQRLNRLIRNRLGYDQLAPFVVGDRVIILANSKRLERMNGEVGILTAVKPFAESQAQTRADDMGIAPTDEELASYAVRIDDRTTAFLHPELIGAAPSEFRSFVRSGQLSVTHGSWWLHVDYGGAITIHKSQGSEYHTVILVVDRSTRSLGKRDPRMARMLAYTAVTRAKQRLIVFDV